MDNNSINVLIVDDDISIRKSLSEAVERAGLNPVVASKPLEAISLSKVQQIHVAVIDCMLPGKNGVDVAVEVRELMTADDVIFFITGIYKDKVFASEAIKKAKAKRFFYKPFDVSELIAAIKKEVKNSVGEVEVTLYSLLSKINISLEDLKQVLEHSHEITGFELPFLVSAFMLLKGTGHLEIVDARQNRHVIKLIDGKIQEIESHNSIKIIGQLLTRRGLLTGEECRQVLKENCGVSLEDSLVSGHLIDPHTMKLLKKEQVALIFEEMTTAERIQVSFTQDKRGNASLCEVNYNLIQSSLENIIEFRLDNNWLQEFYSRYRQCAVVLKVGVGSNHSLFNHPIIRKIEDLFEALSKSLTLEEILDECKIPEPVFYQALHVLTINQIIVFVGDSSEERVVDVNADGFTNSGSRVMARLNVLLDGIKDLNSIEIFQFLGASESVHTKEIEEIFKTFVQANHPQKLPDGSSQEVKDLNHKVFSIVSEAYEIMVDEEKRKHYDSSMKQKKAEYRLEAQSLVERGTISLRQGRFEPAINDLKAAYRIHESQQTLLYLYWAEIKMFKGKLSMERAGKINDSLIAFPIDQKRSEVFHLVDSMLKRESGFVVEAEEALRKSLQLNPSFIDAKRELISLVKEAKEKKKGQSILTGDLSVVVSGLFKKKG